MATAGRWLLIVGLGVVGFLTAAKTHGRQLRLERELAGYWHVTFGGDNPAWVEALWRRERLICWGAGAGVAALTIAVRVLAPRFGWAPAAGSTDESAWLGGFFFHVGVPAIAAFMVGGALSLARLYVALRSAEPSAARSAEWIHDAMWGSAGWWAASISIAIVLGVLAWRAYAH